MAPRLALAALIIALLAAAALSPAGSPPSALAKSPAAEKRENTEPLGRTVHRSPVDVVLADDGKWLVTANETSGTISLADPTDGKVWDELACGSKPAFVELCLDRRHVLVSCTDSGQVVLARVDEKARN